MPTKKEKNTANLLSELFSKVQKRPKKSNKKKEIIADYIQLGSYNAAAKINGVSHQTVKRIVSECADLDKKLQQKKEENTAFFIVRKYS